MDITSEWWTQLHTLIAQSNALQERSQRSIEESKALHQRLEALFEQSKQSLYLWTNEERTLPRHDTPRTR